MPTPIYYPTTTNAVQKTLDAELLTGVTASATLNNVTGLQNKKGIMVIDRVDANNNLTPAKREYISFDGTSGVTVTTLVRGLAGSTDQDHAVGAIVEFVNDVVQQQAIIDGLLNVITTAGALDTTKVVDLTTAQTLTNKRLTSPKINEDVALTVTATQLNAVGAGGVSTRLASKTITANRDMTAASGDVSYTGVGFQPTSIICFYSLNTTLIGGQGMVGSDKGAYSARTLTSGNRSTANTFIGIEEGVGDIQAADIKTFDSDGFTLTWTKTGSPTGTTVLEFLCFR